MDCLYIILIFYTIAGIVLTLLSLATSFYIPES